MLALETRVNIVFIFKNARDEALQGLSIYTLFLRRKDVVHLIRFRFAQIIGCLLTVRRGGGRDVGRAGVLVCPLVSTVFE